MGGREKAMTGRCMESRTYPQAGVGVLLEARNCEPQKTREVRWFSVGALPVNLTMTARNAIHAYATRTDGSDSSLYATR